MRVILGRGSRELHLLMGAYLSGLTLAIAAISLMNTASFEYMPDQNISLAMIGLVTGIAIAILARLERYWVPIVMIPLGVLATQASVVYRLATNPGQPAICAVVTIGRGFPLQYDYSYYAVGPRCVGSLLPLLYPRTDPATFQFNIVFYVAAGFAIMQLLRGITGKTGLSSIVRGSSVSQGWFSSMIALYASPCSLLTNWFGMYRSSMYLSSRLSQAQ